MTYKLGLTGGIASGKTTVSRIFAKAGYPVVDADVIAREAVAPGQPNLNALVAHFGPAILKADGNLDRRHLGQLVFSDPVKRAEMDAINRPFLRMAIDDALKAAVATGARLVVGDIPLLYEADYQTRFDGVVVVSVTPQTQLQRLMARNSYTTVQAQQRITSQMPLAQKVALADFVIDNSGDIAMTVRQTEALIAYLTRVS